MNAIKAELANKLTEIYKAMPNIKLGMNTDDVDFHNFNGWLEGEEVRYEDNGVYRYEHPYFLIDDGKAFVHMGKYTTVAPIAAAAYYWAQGRERYIEFTPDLIPEAQREIFMKCREGNGTNEDWAVLEAVELDKVVYSDFLYPVLKAENCKSERGQKWLLEHYGCIRDGYEDADSMIKREYLEHCDLDKLADLQIKKWEYQPTEGEIQAAIDGYMA